MQVGFPASEAVFFVHSHVLVLPLLVRDEDLVRIWCLDYASEPRFLAFLVNLLVVAPEVLSRFDFSEVVVLICNHCLVSPKDVSGLFSTNMPI